MEEKTRRSKKGSQNKTRINRNTQKELDQHQAMVRINDDEEVRYVQMGSRWKQQAKAGERREQGGDNNGNGVIGRFVGVRLPAAEINEYLVNNVYYVESVPECRTYKHTGEGGIRYWNLPIQIVYVR
jgi:hypothetical protein